MEKKLYVGDTGMSLNIPTVCRYGTKAFLKGLTSVIGYLLILVNFLATGSGSAFQLRFRTQAVHKMQRRKITNFFLLIGMPTTLPVSATKGDRKLEGITEEY
jgi:hypothetical protein